MSLNNVKELGRAWRQTYGLLPDDYLVFDLETSGLDSDRDVILQIGWVKVKNRKLVDRQVVTLNWCDLISGVEREILLHRLNHTNDAMYKRGLGFSWSLDRIKREGKDPITAFTSFAKNLTSSPILFGHNVWGHDYPFVDKCSLRLTGMSIGIPDTRMIDTQALVKAAQSGAAPKVGESYRTYCTRAVKAGGSKFKSSLDRFCVPTLKLDSKYGVDVTKMHEADYDAYVTHLVVEEMRALMFTKESNDSGGN